MINALASSITSLLMNQYSNDKTDSM